MSSDVNSTGTLWIVATPIGNLEDMTYRAVRILQEVDLIACEDTRTTSVLLQHYGIRKPLISYYEHNETIRIPQILERLRQGAMIALVCDAGTPGISDPAFRLVRAVREAGLSASGVPGPNAAIFALSIAGLPTDRFVFEGFLPLKKGRKTRWEKLATEDRTIVIYESPHRILKTLREIQHYLGPRTIALGRELTKKFEEMRFGTPDELLRHCENKPPKGELVLIIPGCRYRQPTDRYNPNTDPDDTSDEII